MALLRLCTSTSCCNDHKISLLEPACTDFASAHLRIRVRACVCLPASASVNTYRIVRDDCVFKVVDDHSRTRYPVPGLKTMTSSLLSARQHKINSVPIRVDTNETLCAHPGCCVIPSREERGPRPLSDLSIKLSSFHAVRPLRHFHSPLLRPSSL